ncbi:MAG: ABC transporter ATP-binding protein [bacterium]|nr:ABC transporter ATP-binding protein [bacterium]
MQELATGVVIEGLVKRYPRSIDLLRVLRHPLQRPEVTALDGIDLELEPGRIVGLVGRNGAGKTTLLKILAGLVLPSEGRVRVAGVDPTHGAAVRDAVNLVVADERSFYWRLTVRENLRFFATLQRLAGPARNARVDGCLERFGLASVADVAFRQLSTGMRQRLAVARGLLVDPQILLLDEATRSLDPLAARNLREQVRQMARERDDRLVIYSTHTLSEVDELCDEVVAIAAGRVTAREELTGFQRLARYHLRTRPAPPADLIDGLGGMAEVRRFDGMLELALEDDRELAQLVDRVRARDLELLELTPVRRRLDELLDPAPGGAG